MNESAPFRSNERPYMWLGRDADHDPEVINALEHPEPLVVVDDSEGVEE